MAVIISQTMPVEASLQMLDAVTAEMGVHDDPPAGMIVHTHYERDGQVHVLDLWESAQAHETFVAERLGPAMQTVAARNGMDANQQSMPEPTITEVHTLVRGR